MNKRLVAIIAIVALALGGAYYASPYWALHQMQTAAKSGEGDRVASYVDFPSVRESLKSQMQASLTKQMQGPEMKDNPFAAMGLMLAGGMLNMMVDNMITPESVANMVNSGQPKPIGAAATPKKNEGDSKNTEPETRPRIDRHYEGLGVFKVEMHDPKTDAQMLTLVLGREGWFGWKLKAIRMAYLTDK